MRRGRREGKKQNCERDEDGRDLQGQGSDQKVHSQPDIEEKDWGRTEH